MKEFDDLLIKIKERVIDELLKEYNTNISKRINALEQKINRISNTKLLVTPSAEKLSKKPKDIIFKYRYDGDFVALITVNNIDPAQLKVFEEWIKDCDFEGKFIYSFIRSELTCIGFLEKIIEEDEVIYLISAQTP